MKKATRSPAKKKAPAKKTAQTKVPGKTLQFKIDKEKFQTFSKSAIKVVGLLLILLLVDFFVQYLNNGYSVAIVNGQRIPKREYMENLEKMYGRQIADSLVEEELVKQLGVEKEINVDSEDVDESYAQIAEQLGGEEALKEALVANDMTEEQLRSQLENELVLKAIIEPTLEYTDEDLMAFFEEYKEMLYEDTTTVTFEEKREEVEKYYIEQKTFEGRDQILGDFREESVIQVNVPAAGEEEVKYGIFKATRNLIANFIDKENTN